MHILLSCFCFFMALFPFSTKAADIATKNDSGPFIKAIDHNFSLQQIQSLIKDGANIDKQYDRDSYSFMPIHYAIKEKKTTMALRLIEAGADMEARDSNGFSPLLLAASLDNTTLVHSLIAKGADIYAKTKDSENLLFLTSNRELAALFLELGLDIHAKNHFLQTPLLKASSLGRTAMVQLLIDRHAYLEDRDMRGNTPLDRAAKYNHHEIAKSLILAGAHINTQNHDGLTPLMRAASKNHVNMIQLLHQNGANPHLKTFKNMHLPEFDLCPCCITRFVPKGSSALDIAKIFSNNRAKKILMTLGAPSYTYPR
ncbi:MAG: ankyrin repeat domain-containing protein [Parachlamydiales bacterium]|nr:ankyrin repeat domain-containing protein [Parachlamydiales bacterium]